MKINIFLITTLTVCFLCGCKQVGPEDHSDSAAEHTHQSSDPDHEHDQTVSGDAVEEASHDLESETSVHTHESGDTTHSHEADGTTAIHHEGEIETLMVIKQEFQDILKTTGVILPSREDVRMYHSPVDGFIHFTDKKMVPGSAVRIGQSLFEIRGGILSDENSDLKFQEIKLEYEKQKKNFDRAGKLIDDMIISEEEFLAIKSKYENARSRYQLYVENRNQGGQRIISKANGYMQHIIIDEGQYVKAGEKVATVITQNRLLLQADVPQNQFIELKTFTAATFTTPYSYRVYRSEALNGRLLAYGKSTDETSFFTPITFEIDHHPDLIPGSFVEINLMGKPIDETIVIPRSALMEEQGKIYVFVQHEDGDYEKQYVELGADDGEFVQVLSGLEENQKVVVVGAYYVRLSTMSSDLPDTHSH